MNVKDYIKVTKIEDGLTTVVPAKNRSHYQQANDIEKKAGKKEIFTIETPSEKEIAEHYPEFASTIQPKTEKETASQKDLEHENAIKAKDAEIEQLKKQLENSKSTTGGKGKGSKPAGDQPTQEQALKSEESGDTTNQSKTE